MRPFEDEFVYWKWRYSVAMLVYQRVTSFLQRPNDIKNWCRDAEELYILLLLNKTHMTLQNSMMFGKWLCLGRLSLFRGIYDFSLPNKVSSTQHILLTCPSKERLSSTLSVMCVDGVARTLSSGPKPLVVGRSFMLCFVLFFNDGFYVHHFVEHLTPYGSPSCHPTAGLGWNDVLIDAGSFHITIFTILYYTVSIYSVYIMYIFRTWIVWIIHFAHLSVGERAQWLLWRCGAFPAKGPQGVQCHVFVACLWRICC